MALYAESSAVLNWLLGQARGAEIAAALGAEAEVYASDLTIVECRRVLLRAVATGELDDLHAVNQRSVLTAEAETWEILPITAEIVERAQQSFPDNTIKTLDALHVASALSVRALAPDLAILSLDAKVRAVAQALGFALLPAQL